MVLESHHDWKRCPCWCFMSCGDSWVLRVLSRVSESYTRRLVSSVWVHFTSTMKKQAKVWQLFRDSETFGLQLGGLGLRKHAFRFNLNSDQDWLRCFANTLSGSSGHSIYSWLCHSLTEHHAVFRGP